MPFDPESGQFTLDVNRQPTGALGAVINYYNANQARKISEAEQLRREQVNEALARQNQTAEDEAAREAAFRGVPWGKDHPMTPESVAPYLKSPEAALPWLRSATSAGAKLSAAQIKAGAQMYDTDVKNGVDPSASMGKLKLIFPDAQDDELAAMTGRGTVPTSVAAKNTAQANKAETEANDIQATQGARIDLMNARAFADRVTAQAKAKIAKGGKLSGTEIDKLSRIETSIRANIERIKSKRDPMTMKLGAVDADNLKKLEERADEISDLIQNEYAKDFGSSTPGGKQGSSAAADNATKSKAATLVYDPSIGGTKPKTAPAP